MRELASIFLVGPMGAGKTTIGRHLARLLGKSFVDLDLEIEQRCGAEISWIFDVEGEEGFRKRESAMLKDLVAGNNIVLATGGGVVLSAENRALLKCSGTVVFLAVAPQILISRMQQDTKRPLLQVEDRKAVIEDIVREREPLYREVADIIFDGHRKTPAVAAQEIVSLIQQAD
ncbi:MAG: shikimate kinase AroK [Gammaproteobacteria bacterium]|nr:shikimate kinase AroK [Gammaproteobacteria bacterium]MBQ0838413.1 shikimate kinase AroK [Gammaproteobacteria bacterium]